MIGINKQDAVGTSKLGWGGLSRLSILWWLGLRLEICGLANLNLDMIFYIFCPLGLAYMFDSCCWFQKPWTFHLISSTATATALDGMFLRKGASLKSQHFGCSWPRFWCAAVARATTHTVLVGISQHVFFGAQDNIWATAIIYRNGKKYSRHLYFWKLSWSMENDHLTHSSKSDNICRH